jgi:hypothetical protein
MERKKSIGYDDVQLNKWIRESTDNAWHARRGRNCPYQGRQGAQRKITKHSKMKETGPLCKEGLEVVLIRATRVLTIKITKDLRQWA